MSLIRQILGLLFGTVLLAMVASVSVNVSSVRDALQTQLRLNNSDNAAALAQVLSSQKGQRELLELAASAQFDTGFYKRIRLTGPDGKVMFERHAVATPQHAPAWFVEWLPIEPTAGRAQVSDGWRALGAVEVVSQSAYAHDELWQGAVRATLALAVVGLLAAGMACVGVARIRRPLDETVKQATSLQRGEYLSVAEPSVPELRRLTRAMNSMVARLRVVFEGQAAQVDSLRRQANCDSPTGLSNRGHFMAQLGATLQREDGQATGGLVLLRVLQLGEVNQRLGRERTDRLIVSIARTLQDYVQHAPEALVGRLNGSDFALVLPEAGVAAESAQVIVALLRAGLADVDDAIAVAAGVVEMHPGGSLAGLMSAADLALARAETAGAFCVESTHLAGAEPARLGEHGWRERLLAALLEGRVQLGRFPVVDRDRKLIHFECPLRVRLDVDGPYQAAAHWLPLANRSRLTCDVDERALALALYAIARDGRPRCVNLSPASLADSGFAARVRSQLLAVPEAAQQVWLEVHESAAADNFELVRELARLVRPCGARFGLEHAGDRLSRIERLFELELDYVKLDGSIGHGVAVDERRAGFVKGVVTMLHSLSTQVIVEGVDNLADAQVLWALGADGLTGPWVSMPTGAELVN